MTKQVTKAQRAAVKAANVAKDKLRQKRADEVYAAFEN